jgi:hypothetical protein
MMISLKQEDGKSGSNFTVNFKLEHLFFLIFFGRASPYNVVNKPTCCTIFS